ncbi:hypothetical protein [Actinacidiphila oryziradicis]|uniref:hypothetical protein n=1 Tax=Actinacidiphila oryziradicis TaxID=2571141 RepID=UPI001FE45269|nr:hypothetical protein [Actinacidiphila oryziradicis]
MTLAVFTDPDRLADWDWTKWLPHGADVRSGTTRLVAVGPEQADALARQLLAAAPGAAKGGTRLYAGHGGFGVYLPVHASGGEPRLTGGWRLVRCVGDERRPVDI